MLQLIIATILLTVLGFGVGFILNMLLKTTWFPIYGYLVLLVGLFIYYWNSGSMLHNLAGYTAADYLFYIGGLAGAALSGWAIKSLRQQGFKMF